MTMPAVLSPEDEANKKLLEANQAADAPTTSATSLSATPTDTGVGTQPAAAAPAAY